MRRWQLLALALVAIAVAAGAGVVLLVDSSGSDRPAVSSSSTPAATVQPRQPVLAALPTGAPVPAAKRLTAAVRPLLQPARLGDLHGLVADVSTGRTLFDDDGQAAAPPASTTKLLTAYAALHVLPPDATLNTTVVRRGSALYLVGGGDMTLADKATDGYPASATLRRLAQLTAEAVGGSRPQGFRLQYDATGWRGLDVAPGWQPDYLTEGDVSRLSPLEVDEGRVTSDQAARVADPAKQAATVFAAELRRAGVRVTGAPTAGVAPASQPVAEVSSAPVPELVTRMLTVSDNELAESLGRAVAVATNRPPSFAGAAAAVASAVRAGGVPTAQLRLEDASGLSRLDRITPATLVAVLRQATTDTALAPLRTGLPVAGFTGTLADRYRGASTSAVAGVVRAKTGTLVGVSAVAGYVVDRDHRLLAFALLADHAPATDPAELALDRIVARLATCGCRPAT